MSKRERLKLIKSVWRYLEGQLTDAFEAKDEREFDWYSEGQQAFCCLLQEKPIKVWPRVKPL